MKAYYGDEALKSTLIKIARESAHTFLKYPFRNHNPDGRDVFVDLLKILNRTKVDGLFSYCCDQNDAAHFFSARIGVPYEVLMRAWRVYQRTRPEYGQTFIVDFLEAIEPGTDGALLDENTLSHNMEEEEAFGQLLIATLVAAQKA